MATIALYAAKVNNMSSLIGDVKSSVSSLKSEIVGIKTKSLGINKSICNLDDVISGVSAATQLQEDKLESLENFRKDSEQFISDTAKIDANVAELIDKCKEDFYDKYYYLKPDCEKSRWEKFCDGCKKVGQWCKDNWKSIVKIAVAVVVIVALGVASVLTGGVLAVILAGAFWGALIGGVLGGLLGGVTNALSGGSFLEGFAGGLLSGTLSGAITGAATAGLGLAGQAVGKGISCMSKLGKAIKITSRVTAVLSVGMDGFDMIATGIGLFNPDSALVKLNQKLHSSVLYNLAQVSISGLAIFTGAASSSMVCFVAGTLVLTAAGYAAIETIQVGDKVVSMDEETFEVTEKPVLETYVRETTEFVHITINAETIQTTPNHPFYVQNVGFVEAGSLRIGDKLLDADGNTITVDNVVVETTDTPVTVYNFQVADFHTYYVGEHTIWVHNANCGGSYRELKKTSDSSVEQVHHMPANSASPLSTGDGVAIVMDTADHKQTASFDRKPGSTAYRKTQEKLINSGDFQGAFNMDVADIKNKFPGKYDEAIDQAQDYLNSLQKKGLV